MLVEEQTQAQVRDGFYCEQYNSIRASSGNHFKNYDFLGKGGNGVAYLVQATSGELKGGLFALKGFHKNSDGTRLQRFLQERQFLKTNTHPNLMRLVDEGEYYGRPFVVQPYMPHTLHQELRSGALSFGRALSFSCQLLSAVQVLQKQGVIHRDIKPKNIFVNGAQVLLGDFGLIKTVSDDADEEDKEDLQGYGKIGAYYYRTPELVAYVKGGVKLDLRSDIFQLGLVIAEMFSGWNPLESVSNFTDDIELNSISHIKGKHAGLVVNAIKAMLEIDPTKRPSIKDCLDAFTGAFEKYARDCYELHERVILE